VVVGAIEKDKDKNKFTLRPSKYLDNARNVYVKIVFNDILIVRELRTKDIIRLFTRTY